MTTHTHILTGLAKIGMFLRSQQWRKAETLTLTPTQVQILVHLAAKGPARSTAIALELGVTQPTISDAVAALVRKGHIRKQADPGDARATQLHPTAQGRRAAADLAVWPDALLGAVGELAPTEQAVFLKALTKMIRSLQMRGAIPVQHMCATCRFFRPYEHDDAAAPHHCSFVDAAFGDASLRLDCDDHEQAEAGVQRDAWKCFTQNASAK